MHKKTVKKIAGLERIRGFDRAGGKVSATEQMIASPWDITPIAPNQYIVCMAGTHQIWILDMNKSPALCYRLSGSGGEGNLNSGPYDSQWA